MAEEETPTPAPEPFVPGDYNEQLVDIVTMINNLKNADSWYTSLEDCACMAVTVISQCITGKCLSWNDYVKIQGEAWAAFTSSYTWFDAADGSQITLGNQDMFDEFSGGLAVMATMFVVWAGIQWKNGALASAQPVFWPTIGTVVAVVVGSLSGVYAGTVALHSVYSKSLNQDNYWNPEAMKARLTFEHFYGGVMYNVVRIFERVVSAEFIGVAILLVAVPYYLTAQLESYIGRQAASADAIAAMGYKLLVNGLVLSLGSWASAYTLTNDTDDILGYYDRLMNEFYADWDLHKTITTGDLLYDLIMHTLKAEFVVLMGLAQAGMGWAYVYYQYAETPAGG
jgi:hypothetical protein